MLIKKIIKHERVPLKSPQGYNVSMIVTSFQEEARNEAIKYCNITIVIGSYALPFHDKRHAI